ncbi:MAG: S41 family peptidase, partial [bacterium]|nr:S41 family peptidase [bacterium]
MNISPYQKFILTIGAASLVSLVIGYELGQSKITTNQGSLIPSIARQNPQNLKNVDMSEFWRVWEIVGTKYVDKDQINAQKLVEGATAGMVSALDDPYSVYLTKTQNTDAKQGLEGTFEGVGMELGYDDDKNIVVISPIKNSPAEKAGVRAGDKIWLIDDKETPGMSLPKAVELIRGKKGTNVKLKIQRDSSLDLLDIEITRDTIYIKSVEFEVLADNSVGHITINRFGDSTKTEWDTAVNDFNSKKLKKLILDVRNNPGGYLDTAAYINSDFIRGVVLQEQNAKGDKKPVMSDHTPRLADVKIIALINKGSASASEIVAGALQDTGKAKLVGVTSFGKGTIQQV